MPKKQKKNKRIIIFSLLGLVIVAAGTFGVLALVNSENNEESRNADHETAIYDETIQIRIIQINTPLAMTEKTN